MISIEEWKHQLGVLSQGERAELAQFLLDSLEEEDQDVEAAWDAEALRRVEEIRAGTAKGRPVEDLLSELRELYP